MGVVVTRDYKSADRFLDQLAPRGPLFGGTEAVGSKANRGDAWVFRGHSDDRYFLIPSAFRGEKAFSKFDSRLCDSNESQIRAEVEILRRFFNLADANGLPLPEDSQLLRATIDGLNTERYFKRLGDGSEKWPPRELWSLLGIVQHYGVPTRLLDWTRSAKIASYFAASGAAKLLDSAKDAIERAKLKKNKLCVWAFAFDRYISYFDPDNASFFSEPIPPESPVAKITAPHAHNPNLHAQDGLFSLQIQTQGRRLDKPVNPEALHTFAAKSLKKRGGSYRRDLFYRIRLPWSEARHLMWRLMQEGLGQATIFPGYGGVVGALEEESKY
jgi:hypothetical protein